ncbi:cation/acetate symporter ActP [Parasulfuritortus cantonensis]|uniref:Cation/acetate symporter ActP n=1 Tax=Parasulfuritortus cantonensis TaxID=2528202 RepID=A0A4R1B5P3_9PROT|nr:cation acetate symporter [Parasulfuritortus cantonensis]TCJ12840.1 cation/acetate symporter ActP [Parasulfuritortus cantonensis]
MNLKHIIASAGLALASASAWAADGGAVADEWKWLTFLVFGGIIGLTMYITWWAAKRVHSASEFYAAGRSVSGFQNGWAIAGDYLSAASFLGIAGLIALYGYDGFMYSVGFLVAYITVLLVIAEPCRNIGKYTLGDILAFRNNPKASKTIAAISTITVSIFYLTAQMVGGGVLVKTLIGIDYEVSVMVVGALMLAYVVFGGMVATTWVQIVKAILLVIASIVLVALVWAPYGFSLPGFLDGVVHDEGVQKQVAKLLGNAAANMTPEELGQRFLEPGLFLKNPIDQISLGMALVLGTAGLPHILMRFFTVPNAQEARKSVVWAMGIIGGFYVLTLFLGMGAAIHVGPTNISALDKGGNMAAPILAQYLGGGADSMLGNFFLAFVAAVAFATIVAVVAGLVLASASAMAHDIYVGVIRGDHATAEEQVKAARISSVIVGIVAIIIGIAAKGQNVAHLVGMAFAVAASGNLPAVFLTLYWKKCNTGGVVLGMLVGSFSAIALVMISPNMTYPAKVIADAKAVLDGSPAKAAVEAKVSQGFVCELFAVCQNAEPAKPAVEAKPGALEKLAKLQASLPTLADPAELEKAKKDQAKLEKDIAKAQEDLKKMEGQTTSLMGLEKPFFRLKNPGLLSIPLGFLCVILGSLAFRDKRSEEMWDELYVRQNTGIHAEGATAH